MPVYCPSWLLVPACHRAHVGLREYRGTAASWRMIRICPDPPCPLSNWACDFRIVPFEIAPFEIGRFALCPAADQALPSCSRVACRLAKTGGGDRKIRSPDQKIRSPQITADRDLHAQPLPRSSPDHQINPPLSERRRVRSSRIVALSRVAH